MKVYVHQAAPEPCNPAANLFAIGQGLRVAAAAGADLAVFPELFVTGYNIGVAAEELAQPAGAATERALTGLAETSGLALVVGLPVRDGKAVKNAALCIDGGGTVRARYAKRHLFGERERAIFKAGSDIAVFELSGRRGGLAICYDIEFPEVARELTKAGAEIILVPTANMTPYWDVPTSLVRARAL